MSGARVIWVVVVVVACSVMAAPCAQAAYLAGYWPLDTAPGGQTPDVSGSGHDGTLLGSPNPSVVAGQISNALQFSGAWSGEDQRVQLGTPATDPALFMAGDFTATMWLKPTLPPGTTTGEGRIAYANYRYSATGSEVRGVYLGRVWSGSNTFEFRVYDANGSAAVASAPNFFTTNPTQGYLDEWVHVAGVFEAGTAARLYIDGVQVAVDTTAVPASVAYKTGVPLNIGRRGGGQSEWAGLIDDVALFNGALEPWQIQGLASGSITPLNVPEPATMTLLGLGALGLLARRRRKP